MDKLRDYEYKIPDTSKEWLLSNGFTYDKALTYALNDEGEATEIYSQKFPVYKIENITTLECELSVFLGESEVKINVYDCITHSMYAPFYYYKYGNYDKIISWIWLRINQKLRKLNINKISKINAEDENMVSVNIKKLNDDAIIPTRGSKEAAGYDLYANIKENMVIPPHITQKIGTGLSVEIPTGYFGAIVARSGLATKQGLRPANAIGICDSDYRGEYIVALHNDSDVERIIEPNERIAQLIVMPYLPVRFTEVDNLGDTERSTGGFGSTGK